MNGENRVGLSRRDVLLAAGGFTALTQLGVGAAQTTGGFGAGGYGTGGYGGGQPSPVARFDTNGQPGIQREEAVDAIDAYNRRTDVGGQPVTARDVEAVIAAYNG